MFLHAVLPALDQNALSISVEHSSWDTGPKQSNPTRTNPEKFTMTLKPLSRGLANLVKKPTVYTAYFWLEDSVVNGYLTIPSGKEIVSSEARKKITGDETTIAEVRKVSADSKIITFIRKGDAHTTSMHQDQKGAKE
ncbi:hypothetical protein F5890DRAFT_1473853 [Lentinula detonsa]|uniref:Uncharacterized protein n=1 Tax=Lentinula detonsa TaxID=2804962 RepID=A0AA38Q1Z7_9AGAR|nr:hypothetical protein F5890DRAFT_1473853 [Lentinula detonsa]